MRIFKNEIGRSMLEMLGVLAVVGVLSVGGIMGYKFAMDKYQANQTVNDINLRALDILIQQSENKPISLDEWENMASIFPIELVFDGETTEERALIQVSNVPQNVCKILLNDMNTRSEISINGYITEDGSNTDCADTNTLAFYFGNNEPCGSTYCTPQAPYCHQETQTCKQCIVVGQCPNEKPICRNFQCEACPSGKPYYNVATNSCGECVADAHCAGENDVCINMACKRYSYDVILGTEESPDGREWIRLKMNNSPYVSYEIGKKICLKEGKELVHPNDLVVSWGASGFHSDKTELGIALANKDGKHHIWTSVYDELSNRVLLINMDISDTRAHPYYYTVTAELAIY